MQIADGDLFCGLEIFRAPAIQRKLAKFCLDKVVIITGFYFGSFCTVILYCRENADTSANQVKNSFMFQGNLFLRKFVTANGIYSRKILVFHGSLITSLDERW